MGVAILFKFVFSCFQASQSSKEVEITDTIADISLESNEIEDKNSFEERWTESKDVTAVERIENKVTEITTEISLDRVEDRDSQDSSSIEKAQKEWTCEVCEVRISSVSDLQLHLQGKQHKVACESKSGLTTGERCTTGITTRKHIIEHEANCLLKTHQPHGQATSIAFPTIPCNSRQHGQGTAKKCTATEIKNHQWWCALCNISCSGKGNMDSHLKGRKHLAKIKKSHKDSGTGKTAAMPKKKAEKKKTSKQDGLVQKGCQKHTKPVLVRWQFPKTGQIKVNVDGSVRKNGRRAGCGGVFRNDRGDWMLGFAHNIGSSSIVNAELWGIHTALHLARKKGFNNICVESDSLLAINLVKQGCNETHPQATIVHAITSITKSSSMEVSFRHTLREGNRVADWLAKWSHQKDVGVHEVRNPPHACRAILMEDLTGVGFLRIGKVHNKLIT